MRFENKVVWITGASSGIGLALAQQLSREGAQVILSSRRQDALEDVRRQLSYPERHHVLPLDLAEVDRLPAMVEQALGFVPGIDILINNGGISQRSLAKDTILSVDRQIMEVDYFGAVALTKALLPHFLQRNSGHLVNISSVAGKAGPPMRTAYAGAKHALIGFMDALRTEVSAQNIVVTNICPGSINTDVSKNALTADASVNGVTDPNIAKGMAAEECARQILNAVVAKKSEVVVATGGEWLVYYLRRYLPGVCFWLLNKVAAKEVAKLSART